MQILPGIGAHLELDPTLALSYLGSAADGVGRSTYTFAAMPFGGVAGGFLLAAVFYSAGSGASPASISSVTIGGVLATKIFDNEDTTHSLVAGCGLYYVPALGLESGNVQVVLSKTLAACSVSMCHLRAAQVRTVATSAANVGNAAGDKDMSINTEPGGAVLGMSLGYSNRSPGWTWTGLDSVRNDFSAARYNSIAFASNTTGESPRAINANIPATQEGGQVTSVSFGM